MEGRLRMLIGAMGVVSAAGCGGSQPAVDVQPEASPLPTAGVAGRPVAVYPLTMLIADEALGWDEELRERRVALDRADSLIAVLLTERAPEVIWVLPDELRRMARQAPGMLANPDQMGTAFLRASGVTRLPDPLRSQLRTLTGMAGDRYALVPASLIYVVSTGGLARAELTMVLADVRTGVVGWRTVARGEGEDPWAALWSALKTLVPGLP